MRIALSRRVFIQRCTASTFPPLSILLSFFLPSFLHSHLPFRTTLCSRRRIRRSNRDPPFLSHSLSPLPPSIIVTLSLSLPPRKKGMCTAVRVASTAGSGRFLGRAGRFTMRLYAKRRAGYTKEANVLIKSPGKRENFAIVRRFCDFPKVCQRLALPFGQFQGGDRRGAGERNHHLSTRLPPPLPARVARRIKEAGGKTKENAVAT